MAGTALGNEGLSSGLGLADDPVDATGGQASPGFAGLKRLQNVISRGFVHGTIAFSLGKKGDDSASHKWSCYVRGSDDFEISPFIKQVWYPFSSCLPTCFDGFFTCAGIAGGVSLAPEFQQPDQVRYPRTSFCSHSVKTVCCAGFSNLHRTKYMNRVRSTSIGVVYIHGPFSLSVSGWGEFVVSGYISNAKLVDCRLSRLPN